MSRRAVTWLLASLLVVILLPLGVVGVLGGTSAGTRWLFDVAQPYLPESLSIGGINGSLFGGIVIDDIEYDGTVTVQRAEINIEFWALPDRRLHFSQLVLDGVEVAIETSDETTDTTSGVPDVDLPFAVELPNLRVTDIRVAGEGFDRSIDSVRAAARFANRRLTVDELAVRSPWLTLDGNGRLLVADSLDTDFSLDWRFTADAGDAFAGKLTAQGARDNYTIRHQLNAPANVSTSGSIATAPVLHLDLDSEWEEWQLAAGETEIVTREGSLQLDGPLDALAVVLSTSVRVDENPEVGVSFQGSTDLARADIDSLTLSANGAELRVVGVADWSDLPQAEVEYQLNVTPQLWLAEAPRGELQLGGRVNGKLETDGPVVDLAVERLSGTLAEHSVTGRSSVRFEQDILDLADTEISVGDNRLSLNGRLANDVSMNAILAFDDLSQLEPALAGQLAGEVRVEGPRAEPGIKVDLAGERLEYGNSRVGEAVVSIDFEDTSRVESRILLSDAHGGGLTFDTLEFDQTGGVDYHEFRLAGSGDAGSVTLAGDGRYIEPDWSGAIRSMLLTSDDLDDWSLTNPVALSLSDAKTQVAAFCLASSGGPGQVCGELAADRNADLEGNVEIRRLPLSALPLELPGGMQVSGFLEAAFDVARENGVLSATGGLEAVDASIETVLDNEPYVTSIDAARLDLDVAQSRLAGAIDVQLDGGAVQLHASLDVDDALADDSPIRGDLRLDVPDLAALAFLFPDIANPVGSLKARAELAGSRPSPELESRVEVRDAAFDVLAAGIRATDVDVTMTQQDLESLSVQGSARSGGGHIAIDGVSRLTDADGWLAELRLSGEEFELLRLPDWQATASPDVRVSLNDGLTRVRGSLVIPTAAISVKTLPESASTVSSDVIVHGDNRRQETQRRAYDVQLATVLGEDVRLSGFGLSTAIGGELRLAGLNGQPFIGNGQLRLRDGRYRAYGQDLAIEDGSLTFNGPLGDPQLDIRATRSIERDGVVAGIRITGTPTNLSSDVFSEPAMREADAVAYLLTGRPVAGAQSSADTDILNSAAFALGLSQAGAVAAQIRSGLGLDTLEVSGGSTSGRIVAGKRIGDRLLVEYGYGIVDKLGTLLLRYQLTSKIILESRTGSMSALDVVYSVKRD